MSGIRVKQHNYSFLEAVIALSTSPSPPLPTNCTTAGYTNGCCNDSDCSVTLPDGNICYCAQTCHTSGECCDDIEQIGCSGKF